MENPATWTEVEHVVNRALMQHKSDRANGVIGLSSVRMITDALRRAGLLKDESGGAK